MKKAVFKIILPIPPWKPILSVNKDRILDNNIAMWQHQKYAPSLWREISTLFIKILKLAKKFKTPFLLFQLKGSEIRAIPFVLNKEE